MAHQKSFPFVHLHVHSNYSLCRGANTIDEICLALRAQGQTVLALTEIDGLYSLIWAFHKAQRHGLRLITGAETRDREHRAVFLVRNREGYENLCQLLSAKHEEGERFDLLSGAHRYRSGLVVLSDSPALLRALAHEGREDLYALCIPGPRRRDLLHFARKHAIPPVASNDVYFVAPDDYATHRVLRAIDCNTALSRIPAAELARPDAYLKTPDEMAAAFPDAVDALENTAVIAERCTYLPHRTGFVFPKFPVPGGLTEAAYLRQLCLQGIKWRYGDMTPEIQARLEKELDIIALKGYASYFLVMWDIVRHASRTCGRGSAAASLVSYLLGITHVDPLKYDLFFERFLHVGREDPPDIDVDFAHDERDDILDYIFTKYGNQHAAMVANHVCFQARAALREIAKCYGLPESEINNVSRRLVNYSIHNIAETVKIHPMFQGVELHDPWPEIIRQADRIAGFPRHLSVHCGGVVITPDPIRRHIPVQKATKGVPIVQLEKDQTEEIGLVKIDILGNRSLAVIRDAVAAVQANTGIALDFNRIRPEEDPATQALIKTGDTIGVFYVESPAMRQLQKKAKTGDFERLVVHSSIIRPASNKFIREYLRRLHGGRYEPLHPLLEDLLQETFGILSYQEDISRVTIALADFDVIDADGLRKAFSKKNNAELLARYREKFFNGAAKKGIDQKVITKVWEMILSFSGYSFCKPHSASYALVSYRSAYLRAHYPAEFMAAVISNQGGYYTTFAYVSEARRMGLRVLPVDINHSRREYTGAGREIRAGFMQLKGLSDKAIDRILQVRQEGGPFRSFEAFRQRTQLAPADTAILIRGGAFDALEGQEARPQLLLQVLGRRAQRGQAARRKHAQQAQLFDTAETREAPPELPPFNREAILQQEAETLGFLLSCHPLALYRDKLRRYRTVPARSLHRYAGRRVKTVGWFVTAKLVSTKHGEPMEFISFEDTTAIYETTFFPKAYRRFCHLLCHTRPYILTGKVEEDFGAVTLTVEQVEVLS